VVTIRKKATYYFLALSLCLSLCSVPASSFALEFTKRSNPQIGSAVVQLTVYNWRGAFIRQGWGFFVNRVGDIVTCRHLLEGGHYVEATTITGETVSIEKILSEDVEGNIVRIGLEYIPEKMVYLEKAAGFPEIGERVLVGGGRGCDPGSFMDGTVEGVRKVPVFGLMRKIITPFSSVGSPVFNEGGELVGMVLVTLDDHGESAWVLPVERITALIRDPVEPVELGEWAENQTTSWFDTPTGSYMKGFIHYWAGDYIDALPYLEMAARDNRYSREAYYLLGCCNDALQRFRKAAEAYSMAIRLNSNTPDIYVKLARTMMKEGDINGSLNCCWRALHLKLDYDAFLLLSMAYNTQGDFQKALATGHAALFMRPDSPEAFVETALAFGNMKKHSDAVRFLKKAIEIKPDYERAYWHLSLAFFNSGDVGSARQTCDALRSINPEMSEKLYAEINR